MDNLPQVLICDDDSSFHQLVKTSLKGKYGCRSTYNTDEAINVLKNHTIDVILLDIQMRTPEEGLKAIPLFRAIDDDIAVVMISSLKDFKIIQEAVRLGAIDYVEKDSEPDELVHSLARIFEKKELLKRNIQHKTEVIKQARSHVLIGETSDMVALKKTIDRVRQSNANVLISGETGTGKEIVARLLRKTLPDGSLEPFIAIDSATIQSSTAESFLFGHEKGAFTGAEKTTKGVFEEAHGGLVYFDELANMPYDIQAKLLRVLQEKEISRLGSSKVIKLDFRVVCATNQDLQELGRSGHFKTDLFQRINVLPIQIPPLRERKEDIPLLIEYLLQKHGAGKSGLTLAADTLICLQGYPWPGNVRELSNLVSYLVTMTESSEVSISDLPARFRNAPAPSSNEAEDSAGFYTKVAQFEKDILKNEYGRMKGNVSRMALALGMDRSHLHNKLKEYGIHVGAAKTTNAAIN